MIATRPWWTARFLALVLLFPCCQTEPRVNSMWRASADARIRSLEGARARLQRESYRLEQSIREDDAANEAVRRRATAEAAKLREAMGALDHELQLLQAAEEDLAKVRARGKEVGVELQPLRAQEAQMATMQQRLLELQTQGAAVREQVRVAEGELAAAQAATAAKLQELSKRREAVQRLDAAAAAAVRAVAEALGPLLPPPSPAAVPTHQGVGTGTPPPATSQPK